MPDDTSVAQHRAIRTSFALYYNKSMISITGGQHSVFLISHVILADLYVQSSSADSSIPRSAQIL